MIKKIINPYLFARNKRIISPFHMASKAVYSLTYKNSMAFADNKPPTPRNKQ